MQLSFGELVDRLSILITKQMHLEPGEKRAAVEQQILETMQDLEREYPCYWNRKCSLIVRLGVLNARIYEGVDTVESSDDDATVAAEARRVQSFNRQRSVLKNNLDDIAMLPQGNREIKL